MTTEQRFYKMHEACTILNLSYGTVRRLITEGILVASGRGKGTLISAASVQKARMRDVGFHLLRHTCLTWLGESGASESVIGAVAGHSGATVTARYVHIGLAALRVAIERMEGEKLIRRAA